MKNTSVQRSSSNRHKARLLLVQKLFERELKNKSAKNFDPTDIDFHSLLEIDEISNYSKDFFEQLSSSITSNLEQIDKQVSQFSQSRPIHELPIVDLCIARIAVAEKYFLKSAPDKVIINEAVELSKEFGGIEDGGFINALLDNMFKEEIKN